MNKKHLIAIIIIAVLIIAGAIFLGTRSSEPSEAQTIENQTQNITLEQTTAQEPDVEENETNVSLESEPQTHIVEMLDFEFSPEDITINQGDTITWVNKGKGPHYVMTSSGLRILDSKTIPKGESWSYTFNVTGNHKYFSPIYQRMHGTVTVVEN